MPCRLTTREAQLRVAPQAKAALQMGLDQNPPHCGVGDENLDERLGPPIVEPPRAVGWRVTTSFWGFIGGVAILLLFSYSFSWVMALLGMSVRSPEIINNASFMILFPLTFISNAFVPIHTMPDVLRIIAEWNPVSALVASARQLFGNTYAEFPEPTAWTLQHPFVTVFIGIAVMLLVFVPLAIRKFESISSR